MRRGTPGLDRFASGHREARLLKVCFAVSTLLGFLSETGISGKLHSCKLISRKSTDHNMCSAMLPLNVHVVYSDGLR